MQNTQRKTLSELIAAGGRILDATWQDMVKTPDGAFWKRVEGDAYIFFAA